MTDARNFNRIRIGIASPEEIRSWSHGEVKKPETINYRTFKPERDGLFCERIFGPVKDWECHCGRYKKVKFKGIVCDRCGVEVTRSKVRRERMGHIELAAPVTHIWYLKGVPSPMAQVLDISPRALEKVVYFASYVVTHVDRPKINTRMDDIRACIQEEVHDLQDSELQAKRELQVSLEEAAEEEILKPAGEVSEESASEEEIELPEGEESIPDLAGMEAEPEAASGISEVVPFGLAYDSREVSLEDHAKELETGVTLLEKIEKRQLIVEDENRILLQVLEVIGRRLHLNPDDLVRTGQGASAVKELLTEVDLEKISRELRQEINQTQGPRRARAIKRLDIVESFVHSKSRPEWMILDVVPVIPPELRPMVQLDGGRFATSDLNDLYRRIINRNNRLKKIIEIKAPESIVNHEKRLLQEAVDALIDNGRRSRPVVGSNNRPLRSLSDMLKGKEGRFRKNLLGKRVDYSGRSVIVVGPELKLHQCGLPEEMALELFKPFVMKTLVERQYTNNIKTAKRMIDRMRPEVWDALEEVIKDHPVMLNRAPTLHRLGIQAFEPVLVEGKAIQLHPLVCHAFNADFDGDQMAVHVPLSSSAQAEARILMMSTQNLFSPADGRPVVTPTQDIVLGCYYITQLNEDAKGAGTIYKDPEEALTAYDTQSLDLHAPIKVRINVPDENGERTHKIVDTTAGRIIFMNLFPEGMRYTDALNREIDKKAMGETVILCHKKYGSTRTIQLLDEMKATGYKYATISGVTIAMTDMDIPAARETIIKATEQSVNKTNQNYRRGLITAQEREQRVLELWTKATEDVYEAILEKIDRFNPIYMITNSGARGSKRQITQLAGMRGLMSDPFGRLIEDLPIKANFHEGLSVLEYFVSTHGARKGLTDTALRTADAGYLTRRLVDVAQDVIVRGVDCGTTHGIYVGIIREGNDEIESLSERLRGRYASEDITDPRTGEVLVPSGEGITDDMADRIDAMAREVEEETGEPMKVGIRSPFTCELHQGICAKCYGRDMASGKLVEVGVATGIIAAESIGEPGTQLTMRTFHTGGVAGQYLTGVADVKKKKEETVRELQKDIDSGLVTLDEGAAAERDRTKAVQAVLKVLEEQVHGLLRVVELFEARKPKGQAIISEVDGIISKIEQTGLKRVVINSEFSTEIPEKLKDQIAAEDIIDPENSEILVAEGSEIPDKIGKRLAGLGIDKVKIRKSYLVPYRGYLDVKEGQKVRAGDRLTEGPLDPQKVLELQGVRGVQEYLVREIQNVYKSQGVDINDKHIEVIVRQMLRKRKIRIPGDSQYLPGQLVDRFDFEEENDHIRELGGTEAKADWILQGITDASLTTDSFLSAASFQKTTRVLTDAAVRGKRDSLIGLKENVIIGRLIPAGTGLMKYRGIELDLKDHRESEKEVSTETAPAALPESAS